MKQLILQGLFLLFVMTGFGLLILLIYMDWQAENCQIYQCNELALGYVVARLLAFPCWVLASVNARALGNELKGWLRWCVYGITGTTFIIFVDYLLYG